MPITATRPLATVSTTTEIKLKLSVQRKLTAHLTRYAAIKTELDTLKAQMAAINAEIELLREDVGEKKIVLDGFSITRVEGTRKKLNLKKLLANGCELAWYEDANEVVPKKPYTLVSCPGEKSTYAEED